MSGWQRWVLLSSQVRQIIVIVVVIKKCQKQLRKITSVVLWSLYNTRWGKLHSLTHPPTQTPPLQTHTKSKVCKILAYGKRYSSALLLFIKQKACLGEGIFKYTCALFTWTLRKTPKKNQSPRPSTYCTHKTQADLPLDKLGLSGHSSGFNPPESLRGEGGSNTDCLAPWPKLKLRYPEESPQN